MQQELWLRAKSQVLSSIKPLRALRAASASAAAISHSSPSPPAGSPRPHARAADHSARANTMSHGSSFPSNSHHAPTYPLPSSPRTPNLGHRSRTLNNAHSQSHNRGNGVKAEFKHSSSTEGPSGQANPIKSSRTHQELHKELLLAHKKGLGLGLNSKPELQQVLERRKREQSDKEEEEQTRGPLVEVLLKRQQKQQEKEKQDEVRVREDAQLLEFVRVRQNLKKIHTAFQNKASIPPELAVKSTLVTDSKR